MNRSTDAHAQMVFFETLKHMFPAMPVVNLHIDHEAEADYWLGIKHDGSDDYPYLWINRDFTVEVSYTVPGGYDEPPDWETDTVAKCRGIYDAVKAVCVALFTQDMDEFQINLDMEMDSNETL